MKNNRLLRAAAGLLIAANIFTFTACSQQSTAASPQAAGTANGQTTIYGKVTAVDGAKITLALGTFNRSGGRTNGASGSGNNSQQGAPQNGGNNGGRQGSTSGSGSGQGAPQNGWQGGNMLTLTGESKTITISDTSVLTRQGQGGFNGRGRGQGNGQSGASGTKSGAPAVTNTTANTASSAESAVSGANTQKSVSLSDITIGTILRVTYETSGEKLVSVQIMGGTGGSQSSSSQSK